MQPSKVLAACMMPLHPNRLARLTQMLMPRPRASYAQGARAALSASSSSSRLFRSSSWPNLQSLLPGEHRLFPKKKECLPWKTQHHVKKKKRTSFANLHTCPLREEQSDLQLRVRDALPCKGLGVLKQLLHDGDVLWRVCVLHFHQQLLEG